jgi:hypothetical protein
MKFRDMTAGQRAGLWLGYLILGTGATIVICGCIALIRLSWSWL